MLLLRFAPVGLLLLPLVEIALFIWVGGGIGAGATILCILATAILGAVLLRRQGTGNLRRVQDALRHGQIPVAEMLDGVFLALAGILLFIPGFLTDALGVCLFLPPVRQWATNRFLARIRARRPWRDGGSGGGAPVIETEYHVKGETRE